MQVEVFELDEVEVHPEAAEAAVALIEELELTGQRQLLTPTKTRTKYRQWNDQEALVYTTLFPTSTDVELFAMEAIPLRVLEVLKEAKATGLFEGFLVLSDGAAAKDPVLVAYTNGKRYARERFILARWGEALDSFTTLTEKALKRHGENLLNTARELRGRAVRIEEQVKAQAYTLRTSEFSA